jgi:hypothetical protein
VTLKDIPKATFMHCVIPAGQRTWANITLTGGEPPFRAEWVIDGKVDSTDPQRRTPVPGGTELAIRVTLTGVGQVFRVREFNRHGLVETDTWTNDSAGVGICGPDGKPHPMG